jgi:hypothetical protein
MALDFDGREALSKYDGGALRRLGDSRHGDF